MKIAAVRTVHSVRPTDSGHTIVVELIDGADDRWTVLIPAGTVGDLVPMLTRAAEEARDLRRSLGRD
jgi:hypothetical protein